MEVEMCNKLYIGFLIIGWLLLVVRVIIGTLLVTKGIQKILANTKVSKFRIAHLKDLLFRVVISFLIVFIVPSLAYLFIKSIKFQTTIEVTPLCEKQELFYCIFNPTKKECLEYTFKK